MYPGPAFDAGAFDQQAFDTSLSRVIEHGGGFGGGFGYSGYGSSRAFRSDLVETDDVRESVMDAMGIPRPKVAGARAARMPSPTPPRPARPPAPPSNLALSLGSAYRLGAKPAGKPSGLAVTMSQAYRYGPPTGKKS